MRSRSLPLLALVLSLLVSGCASYPRRVAVMDFQNATGEARYDFLSAAVPEYFSAQMTNTGWIHLLERQDVKRYLREIDAAPGDMLFHPSRWQALGRRLDAEFLIAGSVSRLNSNFIVTTRLFSVAEGEVVPGSAVSATCTEEYLIYYRAYELARMLSNALKPRGVRPFLGPEPEAAPAAPAANARPAPRP